MKILHLIYTNGIAGAEKYLMHLLPPLKERGIECHLMIVCYPGFESSLKDYCAAMRNAGIPASLIITRKTGFYKAARRINEYLEDNRITYLHSHLLNSDVLATMVKVFFNKNIVIISTKHGYKESILKQMPDAQNIVALKKKAGKEIYYHVTKYVVKKASYNYAVSNAISKLYYNLGLCSTAMPFIHHGVTVSTQPKGNGNGDFRFADKQLIIVGRLEEFKGHRYLVHAMSYVVKKFPGCKLLIIGEGSYKEQLRQLAVSLGIEKNIMFLGFNSDPYSYVNNSDVIILPSLFEPFGLVYIEAFALSTPVVAFDTPAGNEIMKNGDTALLVPARDDKALSEKILYLLENPLEAKQLAERAYSAYLNNFTTARMVGDTAAYYKNIDAEIRSDVTIPKLFA
jgi:glycosyltransferase involved in cell wall biosynthesis